MSTRARCEVVKPQPSESPNPITDATTSSNHGRPQSIPAPTPASSLFLLLHPPVSAVPQRQHHRRSAVKNKPAPSSSQDRLPWRRQEDPSRRKRAAPLLAHEARGRRGRRCGGGTIPREGGRVGSAADGAGRRGDAAGGARAGGGLPRPRCALQRLLLRFLQSMHHIKCFHLH